MNSKTIVIAVNNVKTGTRSAGIERNGKYRPHYSVTGSSWNRLGRVCMTYQSREMSRKNDTITTIVKL